MISDAGISRVKALHREWEEGYIRDVDARYTAYAGKLKESGADLGRYRLVPEGGRTVDLRKLYAENADFKQYVDRYCEKHSEGKGISLEEALKHEIVRQYALSCREKENRK